MNEMESIAMTETKIPERFQAIAQSVLNRCYPFSTHPDDEIEVPRHKLARLLAEAAMAGFVPPIVDHNEIATVRKSLSQAEVILDACRVLASTDGRWVAEYHGLADDTIPSLLIFSYHAVSGACKEITEWEKTADLTGRTEE